MIGPAYLAVVHSVCMHHIEKQLLPTRVLVSASDFLFKKCVLGHCAAQVALNVRVCRRGNA